MSAVLKLKKKDDIFYPESDGKQMGETDFHIQTITYLYQALSAFFCIGNKCEGFSRHYVLLRRKQSAQGFCA